MSVGLLVVIVFVVVGAIVVMLSLVFGLGVREIVCSLSSGCYACVDFEVG